MSLIRRVCLLGIVVLVFVSELPAVWAAPADTQPTRYIATVPPGMQSITVAGRTAMCPPEFADAVRKGLAQINPTTRPTTMASDLLARITAQKPELLREMSADLLLSQSDTEKFLDKTLTPVLQKMTTLHPTTYVVVATEDELTVAMKAGWQAPMFHYNKLDDHTFYEPRVAVSTSADMDDVVIWAPVEGGAVPDDVTAALTKAVERFEYAFINTASEQAMGETRNLFVAFVASHAIKPLKLPPGQQWLGIGLMRAMACKYTAMVTGLGRHELVDALIAPNPNNPLQPPPLDLLNAFDPNSIKPEYMPYYVDAMGRKSTGIVQKLLDAQGDAAVPKILTAIKAGPVPDNQTLVKMIQNATGMDLTSDLLPQ